MPRRKAPKRIAGELASLRSRSVEPTHDDSWDNDIPEEVIVEILECFSRMGSLKDACNSNSLWPSATKVRKWIRDNGWAGHLEDARSLFAEQMARDAIAAADEDIPWDDWKDLPAAERSMRLRAFERQRQVRIDARQYFASRSASAPPLIALTQINNGGGVRGLLASAHDIDLEKRNVRTIEHDGGTDRRG